MKNKFYFLSLLVLILFGFLSCSKEEDNNIQCSGEWAVELYDELNAVSTAATAYSTDPTAANCVTYKNALQVYLNALEPYGDCTNLTAQQRMQWEVAFGDAQESLGDLNCN